MTSYDRKSLVLLSFLVLATGLPFIGRAYFIDDYYHVTMARGILQHPLRPYDFESDDAGPRNKAWERGHPPRMVNPPLFHYYLAAMMALGGKAVWMLRAGCLLFSLVSVICLYFLGGQFVQRPFFAASLLAVTPAFWLTSYSLLLDNALLAFFLASLLCFMEGQEQNHPVLLALSGLLMGLTILVKYPGILIVPVVFLWQWLVPHPPPLSLRERVAGGRVRLLLPYIISGVLLLLWGLWTRAAYGQMHFMAALPRGFHSVGGASWFERFYLDKLLVVTSFLGGSVVFVWLAPTLVYIQSRKVWGGLTLFSFLLFALFSSPLGGFNAIQSALLALFVPSAVGILFLLFTPTPNEPREPRRFLRVWLVLGLLELVVVMPWTAVRYLVLVLPPLCWLFQAFIEDNGLHRWGKAAWLMTFVAGAILAYIDYAQADTVAKVSKTLMEQSGRWETLSPRISHHWYVLGDTFTGSEPYLSPAGWENAFPNQWLQTGDLLLRPRYRLSSWWKVPETHHFRLIAVYEFPCRIPVRVMDIPASAGFYASVWGALPFTLTHDPLERFELYQVIE